jgi:hypothetical protein
MRRVISMFFLASGPAQAGHLHVRVAEERLAVRGKGGGVVDQLWGEVVACVELVNGVYAVALGVGLVTNEDLCSREGAL